jgi:hypothetical protein
MRPRDRNDINIWVVILVVGAVALLRYVPVLLCVMGGVIGLSIFLGLCLAPVALVAGVLHLVSQTRLVRRLDYAVRSWALRREKDYADRRCGWGKYRRW